MIIKTYEGASKEEAINKAKEDLGQDAVIMNIKDNAQQRKGLWGLFRKKKYIVTAAVDEPVVQRVKENITRTSAEPKVVEQEASVTTQREEEREASAIEKRLDNLAQILERQIQDNVEENSKEIEQNTRMVNLIRQQLMNNEVEAAYVDEILSEIDVNGSKLQLDELLANVYQKIVLKLGKMQPIETTGENKPKLVFFIGPTGVGKTTTIAKLASKFKLDQKLRIAIITADTYRVAAVEQIRTYASILSVPVEVVYNAGEMAIACEKYKEYDLILVDTAGRSHKNQEQKEDAKKLLEAVREYQPQVYLVISATTKYRDLVKITQTYSDISSYCLLFTKTDETGALGNILNIRMMTKEPLSYTTFGQNVPDDISVTDAQLIAKQLLGGNT